MATREEICNLALSNCQIFEPILDLATEQSKAAKVCRLWFDSTLLWALEDFDWNFARRRIVGTEIVSTDKPDYWLYAYAFPTACAKVRWIEVPGVRTPYSEQRIRFEIAGENKSTGDYRVIYSNQKSPILVYTKIITDAGLFDAHFAHALGWLLAANIANPMTGNAKTAEAAQRQYVNMRYNAIASHLAEGLEDVEPAGETERARNG